MNLSRKLIIAFGIAFSSQTWAQDNSVGINTNSPNSNAVLDLVSPGSNQGLLVPRLTTTQRNAMISTLSNAENGLMVFDRNDKIFYFWKDGFWVRGLGILNLLTAGGDLEGILPNPTIKLGAITTQKLADLAVTTQKLQESSVTTSKLANNAVTTDKIDDLAVTGDKLENIGITPGSYGNEFTALQLVVDSKGRITGIVDTPILITSDHITNLTILDEDIADGTITISKLDDEGNTDKVLAIDATGQIYWEDRDAFTSSALNQDNIYIGNSSGTAEGLPVVGDITATNTGSGANLQLNSSSVTSLEISDETITASDIGTGAVASDEVLDNSLTADDLGTASVGSDEIATDAVGSDEILAGAVGTSEINDGSILTVDLADDVVTAAKINADVAGTGLGQNSSDGSLEVNLGNGLQFNGDDIEADLGAIAGNGLVDNGGVLDVNPDNSTLEISGDELRVRAEGITANEIVTDAVTSDEIAAEAVGTSEIANNSVANEDLDKANIPLSGFGPAESDVDLGTNKLTNVENPTLAQDAATKSYVDSEISGIDEAVEISYDNTISGLSATNVQDAIDEVDDDLDDVQTLSGVAPNSTNLGAFTGNTIADNETIKGAIQDAEEAIEVNETDIDNLETLSGVNGSTHLGTFSGDIISDNTTVKGAFQEVETDVDALQTLSGVADAAGNLGTFTGDIISDNNSVKGALQETETDVDALQTLSGVADAAGNLGAFSGVTIPDNETVKGALQDLEIAVEASDDADEISYDNTISGLSATNVQDAIDEVDDDLDDVQTLSGVAPNSTNLGAFTGNTIADNETIKGAIQDAEEAIEVNETDIDNLETLSGVNGSTHLGTFSGDIISDNTTVKGAFQEVETDVDALQTLSGVADAAGNLGTFTGDIISDNNSVKGALQETETDVDALQTLSGVADAAGNLGAFSGVTIPDNETVKGALQDLEIAVEASDDADEISYDNTISGLSATNVQDAIDEVDDDLDDVQTLSGVAPNSTNLGAFTGNTIADNETIKGAIQDAEEAIEVNETDIDNLETLSGVNGSTHLGTFSGDIISDNTTVKGAFQEVETDVDALQTLSGVADAAGNLGTFTGDIISDNNSVKGALQELETGVETGLAQDLNDAYLNGNTITTDGTNGDVVITGTEQLVVSAANGIDVANNATVGGTLGVTGTTSVNGVSNTGNITNTGDINTTTLQTSGAASLNSVSVTNALDVDGATTLDQTTINTTDGALSVTGNSGVNVSQDASNVAITTTSSGDIDLTAAGDVNLSGTNLTVNGVTQLDGTNGLQFDAGQNVNNIVTTIGATGTDTNLPTEQAVREAISGSVTADNGVNENPDGNIQLGGDLIIPTEIGVEAGTTLTISDAAENPALAIDENGAIALGDGTITTGSGQVDFGGNLDANAGLDVTGGAGLDVGTGNFTVDNTGNVDAAGTLNADGATTLNDNLTVADGATQTNINNNTINIGNDIADAIDLTGATNINTGNLTVDAPQTDINSAAINIGDAATDVVTVNGVTTLTDNLTVDGVTQLDGTNGLQFDAGQNVNNIVTTIGATGTDTNLPTEQAVREAISGSVTADNGVNENPDGNIQLGGDLIIPTEIGVEAGTTLTISDAAENPALAIDENGAIALGDGTITTGSGQVDFGGNLDANAGLDVTGGAGLDVGTGNFTVDNTGNVDAAGTLNADGATTLNDNLTVADGATQTNINNNTINIGNDIADAIDLTGATNINTGNLTVDAPQTDINSAAINIGDAATDVVTVNGVTTLTDNLTVDGVTQLDGTNGLQFDAGQNVNNIVTTIGATGTDTNLPTEQAVREAISGSVTADNGVNENPDGNIQLGGDLIIPTEIGVEAGTTLTISDAAENPALAIDENGAIALGDGTITTGSGQVDFGGNLDANAGLDVTGGAGLDVGTGNFTVDNTGNVDAAGTLNADGATTLNDNLTVADGATQTNINNNTINIGNDIADAIDLTGATNINTGNLTVDAPQTDINSAAINIGDAATDVVTVNGVTTLTDNLTVDGVTQLDGTNGLQFDAGQNVNNIVTTIGATGTDTNLPTEQAVREAISGSVTADNGVNENPDGNIQLGGDLIIPTEIGVETGTTLTISDAAENPALAIDENGAIALGDGTITTGSGQVDFGGNLDANAGLDVTGLLQADDNVTLGADGTDVVTVNGATTLNDNLTVADGATQTNINNNTINIGNDIADAIDLTGATNINTGNLTVDAPQTDINSAAINIGDAATDVVTVNGVTTLTDNLTVDGVTQLDGTNGLQFDAGQNVNNIVTTIGATGTDTNLPTEQAVREAISGSVTADNGVNENPDGNIQLGGDLIIPTEIGVEAGTTLTISDAAENPALAIDENGAIALGDGTITTGSGQVDFGGNLDANAGLDVTGLLQADDNVTLGADGTDVVTVNGATTLNDNLTVADGATQTNINNNTINIGNDIADAIDLTGATNINTGNLTVDAPQTDINSAAINIGDAATDVVTVNGVTTLTDNLTVDGVTQLDGTNGLQFDAGQNVNNIVTTIGATGTDTNLPTEQAVREAISGSVTADNGVNENPDGNIQLGGDLIIPTEIGVETGTTLTISDAAENPALAIDENGAIALGDGTITTGSGQVDFGGNLDANAGLDVTGLLQADDNVTLGADGTDVVTVNGATTLNDNLTVADGATQTNINNNTINIGNDIADAIDLTGATNINTGNLTVDAPQTDINSAAINIGDAATDVVTVNGVTTLTDNLTVDGVTQLDGTNGLQFDAGQNVNNIVTTIGATGTDTNLPTEQAVREAISGSVTADNGVNENPDGNIQLGGDLIIPTEIGVETGTTLTISDAAENPALAIDENGAIALGDGTITTGSGQVDFGGNLDANAGLDVTGGAGLDVGTGNFTVDNTGNVDAAGTLNADGATTLNDNLTVADGATQTNINNNTINIGNDIADAIDLTGATNINTGNLTVDAPQTDINSAAINIGDAATDVVTVNGVTTLTDNLTVDGVTQLDGTNGLQFDAGQNVNNIVTTIGATGTDTNLPTEQAVREAISGSVTADNGVNENPDGNIQLGGDLIIPTEIGVETGTTLTISDAAENPALAIDENGAIALGDGTITTGSGQVDFGGNLDANAGLDVTGGAGLDVGTGNFTVDNTGNVDAAGTLNADGATTLNDNLTVADGATQTNINNNTINIGNDIADAIDLTGATNINTGNLTVDAPQTDINSAAINIGDAATDVVTVNGVTTLTDNLTVDGVTQLDGTNGLQFDAGQNVSEISTDGTMTDNSDTALPTEQAVKAYVDNRSNNIDISDDTNLSAGSGITLTDDALALSDVAANTILANNTAGTAAPAAISTTDFRTLINVEDGATADQTDEEIQDAAFTSTLSGTETLISVDYDDAAGAVNFVVDNDLANYDNTNSNFLSAGSNSVDISDDTNLSAGSGITLTDDALALSDVAANTILANNTAGTAAPAAISTTDFRTLINVEDGATADQTDEEIQDAAFTSTLSGTETLISVDYDDAAGAVNFVVDNDLANYDNTNSNFLSAGSNSVDISDDTNLSAGSGITLTDDALALSDVAANTILANNTAGAAAPAAISTTDFRTLINVEDGATADQTDEEIQDAAFTSTLSGTETLISVDYDDAAGAVNFVVDNDLANYDNTNSNFLSAGSNSVDISDDTNLSAGSGITLTDDALALSDVAANTILANNTAGAAAPAAISTTDFRTLINVEDGATADQTDEEIQDAAFTSTLSGTETLISVDYDDAAGAVNFVVDNDLANYDNTNSNFLSAGSNSVDISDDTNLSAGSGITLTDDALALSDVAANTILANNTAGAAAPAAISTTDFRTLINVEDGATADQTDEEIQDAAFTSTLSGTETLISVDYDDAAGAVNFVVDNDLANYDNTNSNFLSAGSNSVDISDDTNLSAGSGITLTDDALALSDVAANTILANNTAGAAAPAAISTTDFRTLINVEDGATADQTDEEIQDAAFTSTLSGTETLISVDYDDAAGAVNFVVDNDLANYDNTNSNFLSAGSNSVDISDDTNLSAGSGITLTDDALALSDVAANTILANNTAGTAAPAAISTTDFRTLINVEDGATADQTDEEIQDAAFTSTLSGTETLISVDYDDAAGAVNFVVDNDLANYDNTNSNFLSAGSNSVDISDDTNLSAGSGITLTDDALALSDVAANTILANNTAGAAAPAAISTTDFRTLINVEDGATADQTDEEIQDAAFTSTLSGTETLISVDYDDAAGAVNFVVDNDLANYDNTNSNFLSAGSNSVDISDDTNLSAGSGITLTDDALALSDVAANTILANNTAGAAAPAAISTTDFRTLINVEDGATADQTDEEIQDAAFTSTLSGTETLISVDYDDAAGAVNFVVDNDLANYDNTNSNFLSAGSNSVDISDDTNLSAGSGITLTDDALALSDVAANTILANNTAGAAAPAAISTTDFRTLINVEDGATADQTDEEIQDAAFTSTLSGTETLISVDYDDAAGAVNFVVDNDLANYDNTNSNFLSAGSNSVDISDDTNLSAGSGITLTDDALALSDVAANTILANNTAGTAAPAAISTTDFRTLINVEDGATADQTDEEIQDAAFTSTLSGTETLISVDYDDAAGAVNFVVDNDLANYDNTNSNFLSAGSNSVDISDDTNLSAGSGITLTDDALALSDVAANTILANNTAGAAAPAAISTTDFRTLINVEDGATADQTAAEVTSTATGNIGSTNVDAAIAELEAEKQPLDAGLTSISGLSTSANQMIYTTGTDVYSTTNVTAAGLDILDDADATAQRATLGLVIGTNVQAQSSNLNMYAAINPSSDVQTMLGSADDATIRSNIGLGTIATQAANSVSLSGGSIDGTVIGGSTPAAATVTTLRVSTLSTDGPVSTINSDGTFTVSSDKRLKENIELLQNTLSKLDQLGGYNYNYKADEEKRKQIGVIAQELEMVFPELVIVDERGFKSVNYQGLVPVLIQAIKEQQLEINQLTKKVADQESKLSELSSDNATMKGDLEMIKKMLLGDQSAKKENK